MRLKFRLIPSTSVGHLFLLQEMLSVRNSSGEKGQTLIEFQSKLGEIVTATVERIDPKSGVATIKIGKSEATLPKSEQLGHDDLKEGDHIKVYIADVKDNERGPHAIISRTHPVL